MKHSDAEGTGRDARKGAVVPQAVQEAEEMKARRASAKKTAAKKAPARARKAPAKKTAKRARKTAKR